MVDGRSGLKAADLADQLHHALHAAGSDASRPLPTPPECATLAIELGGVIGQIELEMVRSLMRSHAAGITELRGHLTLDRLIEVEAGLPAERAKTLARVIEWSIDQKRTARALLDADISIDQVDVLARHAFDLRPEYTADEDELIRLASRAQSLTDFAAQVREWRWRNDREAAERDTEREYNGRYLTLQSTLFGGGSISGRLPALEFETVATALRTKADPNDGPIEPRSRAQRTADQLVDLCAASLGRGTSEHHTADVDGREDIDDGATGEPTGRNAGPVAIDAVLDIQTILGNDPAIGDVRRALATGEMVPEAVAQQLMCDATFRRVIFDGPNRVLNTGAPTELVPRSLRRAVQRRDRHCQFAGCGRHWSDCDVHHIRWRSDGGLTAEWNLCLLCPRHHTLVHQAGYHLARDPDTAEILTWLPDIESDEWALDQHGQWTKATGPIVPDWSRPLRSSGQPPPGPDPG